MGPDPGWVDSTVQHGPQRSSFSPGFHLTTLVLVSLIGWWPEGHRCYSHIENMRKKKRISLREKIPSSVLLANGLGPIPIPALLTEDLKAMLNCSRHLTSGWEDSRTHWKSTLTRSNRLCHTRVPALWCQTVDFVTRQKSRFFKSGFVNVGNKINF